MRNNTKQQNAFTLVEIVIAMTIVTIVSALVMDFFIESLKSTFISEQKNLINQDIRKITQELSDNAKSANYFRLYKSFNTEDRDHTSDALLEGNAGNFLLLVYQEETDPQNPSVRPIEKLVGYFLDSGVGDTGPIKKFEVTFSPAATGNLESLIPSPEQIDSFEEMVHLSQGLANKHLFYNYWNKSIMVNGKIIHGNDAKRVTDTYNFTISPRG